MSAVSGGRETAAPAQQVLFTHLLFSSRRRPRPWSSGTALTSVLIHAALFGAAAYATTGVVIAGTARTPELVTYLEVREQPEAEQPPAEPEPPRTPEAKPAEPPPLLGTQTLTPPMEAPAEIPEVDVSASAVRAEDYSGIGPVGGIAGGVPGGVPVETAPVEAPAAGPAFAYELATLDRMPQLLNGAAMAAGLKRLYPPMLQRAGAGGTVLLKFVVEANGSVDLASVQVLDTPHEQLGQVSIQAIEKLEFRPGRFRGQNVRVWVQMPITWQPS
jgi:TonB family protein